MSRRRHRLLDILRKIDAARQALAALQPTSNAISETAH
jgi:hypothetical protein